jgi:hypothetical protein
MKQEIYDLIMYLIKIRYTKIFDLRNYDINKLVSYKYNENKIEINI